MAGPDCLQTFMNSKSLSLNIPEAASMARGARFTRPKQVRFFHMPKNQRVIKNFGITDISTDKTSVSAV
jgi:hypothetical protein